MKLMNRNNLAVRFAAATEQSPNNSAMRFDAVNGDGQELNGLLMPCRDDIKVTFKPPTPEPEPTPVL